MRLKMRGTEKSKVGRTSARFSMIFETDSARPIDAPYDSRAWSSTVCPKECAHGRNDSETSSDPRGKISCSAFTFDVRFLCDSSTPLGFPVVPLV